jgi:hypothetical protein
MDLEYRGDGEIMSTVELGDVSIDRDDFISFLLFSGFEICETCGRYARRNPGGECYDCLAESAIDAAAIEDKEARRNGEII